jgi:hypothetical protein
MNITVHEHETAVMRGVVAVRPSDILVLRVAWRLGSTSILRFCAISTTGSGQRQREQGAGQTHHYADYTKGRGLDPMASGLSDEGCSIVAALEQPVPYRRRRASTPATHVNPRTWGLRPEWVCVFRPNGNIAHYVEEFLNEFWRSVEHTRPATRCGTAAIVWGRSFPRMRMITGTASPTMSMSTVMAAGIGHPVHANSANTISHTGIVTVRLKNMAMVTFLYNVSALIQSQSRIVGSLTANELRSYVDLDVGGLGFLTQR